MAAKVVYNINEAVAGPRNVGMEAPLSVLVAVVRYMNLCFGNCYWPPVQIVALLFI